MSTIHEKFLDVFGGRLSIREITESLLARLEHELGNVFDLSSGMIDMLGAARAGRWDSRIL